MTTDGTSGISVERLDWNNYPAWAANMKFFLTTKKCWHMVIHTEPAANAEDRKADELALSYIGLCVKPVHQPTILRCTTSNQAWTTLQETFAAKTFARKLQLRRDLNSLKMATNETVTAFTSRAKALQDQLTAAGHRVDDIDVACQVLAGLPSSFDTVVTVIETTTASTGTFTVDEILPHLLQAEKRRSKTDFNRSPDSALMATFQLLSCDNATCPVYTSAAQIPSFPPFPPQTPHNCVSPPHSQLIDTCATPFRAPDPAIMLTDTMMPLCRIVPASYQEYPKHMPGICSYTPDLFNAASTANLLLLLPL